MEQTKALNALTPFLALTKSATSTHAAVDLIDRAISAPNTFVFAELLDTPQVRALFYSRTHSSYFKLLEIFSYGTYETYRSTPHLPKLKAAQATKLRQLSLLSLARNPANLSYHNLLQSLDLQTRRDLENLVISVIYAGLVEGNLDPYNERVIVTSISPLRDLAPNSIPKMLKTLDQWSARCVSTLADLEKQIALVKSEALMRQRCEAALNAELDILIDGKLAKDETSIDAQGTKSEVVLASKVGNEIVDAGNNHHDFDEAMDIDEQNNENTKRSLKKRGLDAS